MAAWTNTKIPVAIQNVSQNRLSMSRAKGPWGSSESSGLPSMQEDGGEGEDGKSASPGLLWHVALLPDHGDQRRCYEVQPSW
jgi:hypothetical protein